MEDMELMFQDLRALLLILGGYKYVEGSLDVVQKDPWTWCTSSFHIGMHEWGTLKRCGTWYNPSSVLDNSVGTFLPNGECDWRVWLMSFHNHPKGDLVPEG